MFIERPLTEAQVKKAVSDYLTYQQNAGKLLFLRLNAGSFILQNPDGTFRRRVQGAKKGTADFVVFQGIEGGLYFDKQAYSLAQACRVTFLEIKGSKGKQSQVQHDFEIEALKHHCRYFVVRDVGILEQILA